MGVILRTEKVAHYDKSNLENQTYYKAYYTHILNFIFRSYVKLEIYIILLESN